MNKFVYATGAVATLFALSACGNTRLDRAVSGSGIGAAGGAVVGAVAGGPILGAAAIGAVGGAAIGAITNKNQINLGKAWWEH